MGAERLERGEPHLVGRHADLETGQILRLYYRADIVGDVAEAVFPPGENLDPFRLQQSGEIFAQFAVKRIESLLTARPGIGHFDDAEFRLNELERAAADNASVHGADLHAFNHFLL